jgi:hypothetical protein
VTFCYIFVNFSSLFEFSIVPNSIFLKCLKMKDINISFRNQNSGYKSIDKLLVEIGKDTSEVVNMLSNRRYLTKLDRGVKKAQKNLFKGAAMKSLRLTTVLNNDSATFDWFNEYFRKGDRKNWLDDYCHIKVQGNSLRRELVLTKDSAIVPNLDQFHVLGDLDEVLGSKINAHVAPEVITITTTVSAPLAIPANVSIVTPAIANAVDATEFDAVDHLVVPPILSTELLIPLTVTPAAVLPSKTKKITLGSKVPFNAASDRFVYQFYFSIDNFV